MADETAVRKNCPSPVETVLASLLEATEAALAAAREGDPDGLERAIRGRRALVDRLSALAQAPGPDAGRTESQRRVRALADRVAERDAETRRVAAEHLDRARAAIRTVNRGHHAVRTYRGPPDPLPRFSDRRG